MCRGFIGPTWVRKVKKKKKKAQEPFYTGVEVEGGRAGVEVSDPSNTEMQLNTKGKYKDKRTVGFFWGGQKQLALFW